jgi:hypothetical protein
MKSRFSLFLVLLLAATPLQIIRAQTATPTASWRDTVNTQLPLLGQGNWIVIADVSYPWSSIPGAQTIVTGAGGLDVLQAVLAAIGQAKNLRPVIYTENEINFVTDKYAPGVTSYRGGLAQAIGTRDKHISSHEDLVRTINQTAQSLHVLVLKTTQTLPYSSIYIQLENANWTPEGEKALKEAMAAAAAVKK